VSPQAQAALARSACQRDPRRASDCWPGVVRAVSMAFTKLDAGPNAVPEVCTTIEEVGSTGVGALTIVFIILMICGCVFVYKAVNCGAQRKCVRPRPQPARLAAGSDRPASGLPSKVLGL
jgi:hypothetical protein